MHDARSLAVRLDIRPRLVLRDEPPQRARRRGFALPPLALPAAGYWVAMAGLTYFFTTLGPYPLDSVEPAAAAEEPAAPPLRAPPAPALTPPSAPPLAAAPSDSPSGNELDTEAPQNPAPAIESDSPVARAAPEERVLSEERERSPAPQATAPTAREEPPAPMALSFPEFTDSSRPSRPERAADGPRIDSLFERAEERPLPPPNEPKPPEVERTARAVVSCEAAVARNNEQLTIGGPRGPKDISREAYASILQNGSYLRGCSIPERTVFEICTAVRDGHAVGVTVVSNPPNSGLNACVRSAVSRLKFPQSPKLDVTHTRFDAVRH
jgi:hypothetical protein